jgi:hypothetical protein
MDWNRFCVVQIELKVQRRTFSDKISKIVRRKKLVDRSGLAVLLLGQGNETSDWLDVREFNNKDEP